MIDEILFQIRVKDEPRIVNGRRTVGRLGKDQSLIVAGVGGKALVNFVKDGWVEVRCVPGLFLVGCNVAGSNSVGKIVKDILDRLEWLGIRGWVRNSVRVIKLDITGWLPERLVKVAPVGSFVYPSGWVLRVGGVSRVCCYDKARQMGQRLGGHLRGWRRFEVSWSGEILKGRRNGLADEKQLRVWVREVLAGTELENLVSSIKFNPPFAVRAFAAAEVEPSADFGKIWLVPGVRSRALAKERAKAKREGRFFALVSLCSPDFEVAVKSKDCSAFIKENHYE